MTDWNSDPRTVLEHLIRESSRTYEETSEAFDELARELEVSASLGPRQLRRLASGERSGTRPGAQRILQQLFGIPAALLFRPWTPEVQAQLGALHQPSALSFAGVQPTQEDVLDMTIERARQFAIASRNVVADEAIEQLHDDVRHLATVYPQQPLSDLLGDLASTQDTVFAMLEGRHRPSQSEHLYLLAGVLGGVLAKASHDMGDAHGALTHSRAAYLCAEQVDHDGLRAWIKGLQSFIAFWAKRPREALRYAQDGARFAERATSTASVWLPVNEARAWAALGNATEARAAIERAETAADAGVGDEIDEFGGICTFGDSRRRYYAADAFALLPSEAEAATAFSLEAIEAYANQDAPDWSFSDQAGSHADLAIARVAAGEIDGAAEALAPVLELPAEQRINGIVASTQRVHQALSTAPASELVEDLQQDIEAFARTPLAAIPR